METFDGGKGGVIFLSGGFMLGGIFFLRVVERGGIFAYLLHACYNK